jgi:DNA replication protein DnaC
MKTLEGFEFDRSGVSAAQLRDLAAGDYVTRAEPILLVGEAGTGKSQVCVWRALSLSRSPLSLRSALP